MAASQGDRLPDEELIAQMSYVTVAFFSMIPLMVRSILIFAATDTTSSSLARIVHLLAEHPDVQEKLREEIINASDNREISYDELVDLPYMDAVCRETLRL